MAKENPPNHPNDESQRHAETERETTIDQHIGAPLRDLHNQLASLADEIKSNNEDTQRSQDNYQKRYLLWTRVNAISLIVFSVFSLLLSGLTLWVLNNTLAVMDKQREITDKQLGQMRDSNAISGMMAEATTSAALTADATLKSAQKSFQIDQRPYLVADATTLVFQQFSAGKTVKANITFKNIGRTPAIKQMTFASLLRYRRSSTDKFFAFLQGAFADLRKQDTGGGKYAAFARSDVAPNGTFWITKENSTVLSVQDMPEIQTSALTFFYIGIVKYTDSFDGKYETEFCHFYFGTDAITWHICDAHNTIK